VFAVKGTSGRHKRIAFGRHPKETPIGDPQDDQFGAYPSAETIAQARLLLDRSYCGNIGRLTVR
jgi:hypothetical protein